MIILSPTLSEHKTLRQTKEEVLYSIHNMFLEFTVKDMVATGNGHMRYTHREPHIAEHPQATNSTLYLSPFEVKQSQLILNLWSFLVEGCID